MNEFFHEESVHRQPYRWEKIYSNSPDFFGEEPSGAAVSAVPILKENGVKRILELGGGQGRDTVFFAQNAMKVDVLDYSEVAIAAINQKASKLKLDITAAYYDIREPLPFENDTFDACYSHILFNLAFSTEELAFARDEVWRVLKPGGLHIFTVRNTKDPHYRQGIHEGGNIYEVDKIILRFFDMEAVGFMSKGFDTVEITDAEDGELPRKLYFAVLRKI